MSSARSLDDTAPLVLTNGNTLRPSFVEAHPELVSTNIGEGKTPAFVLDTDTKYKASAFIETYTGRPFWPLNPSKDNLSIIDIAHALSNQCRYSGHTQFFYSVAQHCVLIAQWLKDHGGTPLECLQILLHDAPEAYLVDMPRPVKQHMPEFRVWDKTINDCIRDWMGWSGMPIPAIQDELDSRIIMDERAHLMDRARLNDWMHKLEPLGIDIVPWTNVQAEQAFLIMYASLSKEVYGEYQYLNYSWGPLPTISSSDCPNTLDVMEVDVRGKVARLRLRDGAGMLTRDPLGGIFPRPKWKWVYGDFKFTERG